MNTLTFLVMQWLLYCDVVEVITIVMDSHMVNELKENAEKQVQIQILATGKLDTVAQ